MRDATRDYGFHDESDMARGGGARMCRRAPRMRRQRTCDGTVVDRWTRGSTDEDGRDRGGAGDHNGRRARTVDDARDHGGTVDDGGDRECDIDDAA
jgi:hypothetical protein